ncbi:hypothetical protein BDQ17DRAFT_1280113 [Cyathus striatus]|nr:hypothetical protein BDQ17DRAFT_1280113 [Cyathus striatus]
MHRMLKAVSFLHKHKIFHRDIKLGNTVFNYVPADKEGNYCWEPIITLLRSRKQLQYAIIDFGLSIKFPDNYSLQQCRLPHWQSRFGAYSIPNDCMQGEFDFDPFAYDVGVLGCVFSDYFKQLIPYAPMLAPLIDKMLARNIRNRFTASEALQFFEEMRTGLTEEQLMTDISYIPRRYGVYYESYDRWAGLPEEFVKGWSKYREPPLPRSTVILRSICEISCMYSLVAGIRRLMHSIKSRCRWD